MQRCGAEGAGERNSSRVHAEHGTLRGAQSHDTEIRLEPKLRVRHNPLSHPGGP